MTGKFAISRVQVLSAGQRQKSVSAEEGGQFDWSWAVWMPHRVLSDLHGSGVMPMSPLDAARSDTDDWTRHAQSLGYFTALQSFLTYSFGWTRHDLGLLWWYENGQPDEDPRFALLRQTWDADGLLKRYLSWCVEKTVPGQEYAWPAAPLLPWAWTVTDAPAAISDGTRASLGASKRAAQAGPLEASPWEKHLEGGHHISAPAMYPIPPESRDASRIVGTDRAAGTATFISEQITGWYSSLMKRAEKLPRPRDSDEWRIEVYVKPLGYLGEYRRSPHTRLWFSGHHRYHHVGNGIPFHAEH